MEFFHAFELEEAHCKAFAMRGATCRQLQARTLESTVIFELVERELHYLGEVEPPTPRPRTLTSNNYIDATTKYSTTETV